MLNDLEPVLPVRPRNSRMYPELGGDCVAWVNDDMVLYHGCSDLSLFPNNHRGIVVTGGPHNISHTAGAARPDFGPGFYATT
jgi:hypothetical protein